MGTIKTKHVVAGSILGLLSGLTMLIALAVTPFIILPTLIVSLLGIWAGLSSAIIASVSYLFVSYALGGGMLLLVVFETSVIPAWCVIALIARRSKYYEGIKQSVFMQCGALFVLVMGAWLTIGGDIVESLMNMARGSIEAYPNDYVGSLLSYMGQMGLFGTQTGYDFSKVLTSQQQSVLLDAVFSAYTTELKRSLVSILLSSGVITGAVSYAACAGITARRGDEPIIDYAHAHDWRLSPSLIIGPPVCALIVWIAYMAGLDGADSAYLALYNLSVILFVCQGIGAVDRRFRKTGATKALRMFIIVVLVITGLRELLAIIGVASALFGSKGLVLTAIKKRRDRGDGQQ